MKKYFPLLLIMFCIPSLGMASDGKGIFIGPVPVEFVFFGFILLGVAVFHNNTLSVALSGLVVIVLYKLFFTDFNILSHLLHEEETLLNLSGLLLGFAVLSWQFDQSKLPDKMPHYLPDDWKGGFVLLLIVFILSAFLDNIAGAMIGGTIAFKVYKGKVHIGFLAAIVAASNAGGAGSVLGATTTTMMWIAGAPAHIFLKAYIGSVVAFIFFGIIASIQQDKFQRIEKDSPLGMKIDYSRLIIVGLMLVGAVMANIFYDMPALGLWIAIAIGALLRKTDWKQVQNAIPGTLFLLALVFTASMMPVKYLPSPSGESSFVLGLVSAVFDNIPLIELTLKQDGYDWGILGFAVGFGGSILWFGSSAGVALCNSFPEARSVYNWARYGWHIGVAYVLGFLIMIWLSGWQPIYLK